MAKVKKEHKDIEFGDDDPSLYDNADDFNFDMDDSGMDLSEEFESKNRSPITRTGNILGKMAMNVAGDEYFIRETISEKLPKDVSTAIDHFDTVGAGVSKVYGEVSKNLQPGITAAGKTLRQVISRDSKVVPKWLNDKLSEIAEGQDALQRQNVEAERNDFIGAQLQELMSQQQESVNTQILTDTVEREKDRSVETERFNISSSIMQQMNQSLLNVDNYNRNFQTAFAKKQLEVSYRSLFVMQDILAQNRDAYKAQLEQLAAISKNTSLPDYVKYRGIEITKEIMSRRLHEKTTEPIVNKAADITKKLFENLTKVAGEKATDISDALMSGTDFISMMKDMREMNKEEYDDEMIANAGGLIVDMTIGERIKSKIKQAVGYGWGKIEDSQYYKPGMRMLRKGNALVTNAPHLIQDSLNDSSMISKRLRAAELEVEERDKLLEIIKKVNEDGKETLSGDELELYEDYDKKNWFVKKGIGLLARAKKYGLGVAESSLDTLGKDIVSNQKSVSYSDVGAASHYTKQEDILQSQRQVSDAIVKVIPTYLRHILQEVTTIRTFGTKTKDKNKVDELHFDWDTNKLATSSSITKKFTAKAYDTDKVSKLRESLSRMLNAGQWAVKDEVTGQMKPGLSDGGAQALMDSIMVYWNKKPGSNISLFTAAYFDDKYSSTPKMQPLPEDAEQWLARNIGSSGDYKEDAARRTREKSAKRFETISKYWEEAVDSKKGLDPNALYTAARRAGYSHEHIGSVLNVGQKGNRDFLGNTNYEFDPEKSNAKISSMLSEVSFSQASKEFKNEDDMQRAAKEHEDQEAVSFKEEQRLERQAAKERLKLMEKSGMSPDDFEHSNKDTKIAKRMKIKRATGGAVVSPEPDGIDSSKALTLGKDVVLAGGEHVFTDKEVKAIGGGDIELGHKRLYELRQSIKGSQFGQKTASMAASLKAGLTGKLNEINDGLGAAAQVAKLNLHAASMKKKLDNGYKLQETDINDFAQVAAKVTGMSTQAVALAVVYSSTDSLASKLAQLSKSADIEQIKEIIEKVADENSNVKDIITAKDKARDTIKDTYNNAKTKATSLKDKAFDKLGIAQEPEPVQDEDEDDIKHVRLSNNRKEHNAAVLRGKLESKRKIIKSQFMLTGDREQQRIQALLDNAIFTKDYKAVDKYRTILSQQYGVKTRGEILKDEYDKLLNRVKNKDEKAEISHRDLGAAIRSYLDDTKKGIYHDYRKDGSIAKLLAPEVFSKPEIIANMLDWTMFKALMELLEQAIPFRGHMSVVDLHEAIKKLYENAQPLAQRVRQDISSGMKSPLFIHFTAGINDSLKNPSKKEDIPQQANQEYSQEFKDLVDACRAFVKTSGSQLEQNVLYSKLSSYTGIGVNKIKAMLSVVPTKALINLISPQNGPEMLASIASSPEKFKEFMKSGLSKVYKKADEFKSKNPKVAEIIPSTAAMGSAKTKAQDVLKGALTGATEYVQSKNYQNSDQFVGPQRPTKISDQAQKLTTDINESIVKSYEQLTQRIQDTGTQLKDISAKSVNQFKEFIGNNTPEQGSAYVQDVSSAYRASNAVQSLLSNEDNKQSPINSTKQANQESAQVILDSQKKLSEMILDFQSRTGIEVSKTDNGFMNADIYISGTTKPVMKYKDIMEGYFLDANTGNTIKTTDDITGDIIDIRSGEIVVSADQLASLVHIRVDRTQKSHGAWIKRGLLSKVIPFGTDVSKVMGSRIGAIIRGQYGFMDLLGDAIKLPFTIADSLVKFTLDRPTDIYLSDGKGGVDGPPVLTKKKMKDGEYFNKDGSPIFTPIDIKGIVVDKYGDILIDKEELKQGLCFKNGRKIEGPWTRVIKAWARTVLAPVKWAAKGAWWLTKKANKLAGWMLGKGARGLFRLDRDKGSIEETQTEIAVFQAQRLANIDTGIAMLNKRAQDQEKQEKAKTLRAGSWKERLFGKKKDEIKDAKAPPEATKEKSMFSKALDFIKDFGPLLVGAAGMIGPAIMNSGFGKVLTGIGAGIGVAVTGISKVVSWVGSVGTLISTALTKLMSMLGMGKIADAVKSVLPGAAKAGAGAAAGTAAAGAAGAAAGKAGMLTKAGNVIAKGASIKGALVVGGASLAVNAVSDENKLGGRAAITGADVASSAMTGAALGSFAGPIGTAVGAAAGAAYGLWSNKDNLSQMWTQWKDLDTKSIRAVRYAAYGFTGAAAQAMHRSLVSIEAIFAKSMQKSSTNTQYQISTSAMSLKDLAKLMGFDTSKNESLAAVDKWFMTRFKPTLEAHINALMQTVDLGDKEIYSSLDTIDDKKDQDKARYITIALSMIPQDIPAYVIEGSSLLSKMTLTTYAEVVNFHKAYCAFSAGNANTAKSTIKEGITKTSNEPKPNASGNTNVNADQSKMVRVRDSIGVSGQAGKANLGSSEQRQTNPNTPPGSTVQIGYTPRGTTDYRPTGDGSTYVSGTTMVRSNSDPIRAAAGMYSTQKTYNPMERDGDDVIEDVEYYDKDITEESKPTAPAERGKAPGTLLSAKGGLYTGQNAMKFIVFGKNSDGLPIDLDGLIPEFRALVFGCIEEYGSRTGKTVQINSGARSTAQQAALYKRMPGKAAPPGSSPHEHGFAIDINTADIDAMEKLGLMRKYGLCRPLSAESWHVEPIGVQIDYYRCKTDRAYAIKMITASPGRGGSGPGDTMRGKGYKVRRITAMLKEIWDKPPLFITEDTQMAAKPTNTNPYIQKASYTPDAQQTKGQSASAKGPVGTELEKESPKATRTSYANGVDQAQAATTQNIPVDWKADSSGSTPLKDFNITGKTTKDVRAAIVEVAKSMGMNPDIPLLVAQLESSMGKNLSASTSSAKGVFQFTTDTWKDAIKMYIKDNGADAGITGKEDPTDLRAGILVGMNFIRRRLKNGADAQELYLRHLLGDSGFNSFKSGTQSGKLPYQSISPAAAKANANLFFKDGKDMKEPFTLAEFNEMLFRDKFVQAAANAGLSTVPGSTSQSISRADYAPANTNKSSTVANGNTRVNAPPEANSQAVSAPSTKTANYVPSTPTSNVDDSSEIKTRINTTARQAEQATQNTLDPVKKILEQSLTVQTEHLGIAKQMLSAIKEHVEITKSFASKAPAKGEKSPSTFEPKSKTVNSRTIPNATEFPDSTVNTSRKNYDMA